MIVKQKIRDLHFQGLDLCDLCGGPLLPGAIGGICRTCRKPRHRKAPRTRTSRVKAETS